jgi:2-polyprenyl-3-methyl-5-hydroxy-6-metoxy-1,4-benzoquinol methylase
MSRDWDARHAERDIEATEPAAVLRDHRHLLPASGTALDLAAGLGANARLLARHGLRTFAWDASREAMERLGRRACAESLPLEAEVRDVVARPPEPGRFDVIVVSRFLDRSLCPALIAALAPRGLLFYQTFTRTGVRPGGPRNPAYRLAEGELLVRFGELEVLVYREERDAGDPDRGLRDQALLVGRRPWR